MEQHTFMKERAILPLVLTMSLPMVLSMLVSSLYNIVDSYFVAQISEDAMTALSLVFPMQNLINAVTIGFSIGVNAVISYYLGAQDGEKANIAATQGLALSAIHGVILTVGCIAVMPAFLGMFTDDQLVISLGFLFSSVSVASTGALEGLSRGGPSLVITALRYVVVIIPAAFLLSRLWGAQGVWAAFPVTEVLTAALSYLVYRRASRPAAEAAG